MINEITGIQGESVVLTCLLHAIPLPTIVWTKDHQLLSTSDRFVCRWRKNEANFFARITTRDHHFRLQIDRVSVKDRGRYQCEAENVAGRSKQIFDLQIYGASVFRLSTSGRRKLLTICFFSSPARNPSKQNLFQSARRH